MMVLNFHGYVSSSTKPWGVSGGEMTLTEVKFLVWGLVLLGSADDVSLKGFTLMGEVGEGVTHE
jgi:hypothetical protein